MQSYFTLCFNTIKTIIQNFKQTKLHSVNKFIKRFRPGLVKINTLEIKLYKTTQVIIKDDI